MRPRRFPVLLLLAVGVAARADDGILYSFGAPKLMHGESTVRMVREFVSAKVYTAHADVYCRFVIRNDGPPVNARIGFPDGSDHIYEDGETPGPDMEDFRSRVDGNPVSTRVESPQAGSAQARFYHVKTVHFGPRQTRVIEDWYRGALSGGATDAVLAARKGGHEGLYAMEFEYVMESGGSWKGNISEATMRVDFMQKQVQHLHAVPQAQFGSPEQPIMLKRLPRKNVVSWAGFSKPTVSGNRMVFRRRNFKPTEKDNVYLIFDWRRFNDSPWTKK